MEEFSSNWLDKILALAQSRRFATAVMGVLVVAFQDVLGMTPEQAQTVAGLLMAWIVGDSLNTTSRTK